MNNNKSLTKVLQKSIFVILLCKSTLSFAQETIENPIFPMLKLGGEAAASFQSHEENTKSEWVKIADNQYQKLFYYYFEKEQIVSFKAYFKAQKMFINEQEVESPDENFFSQPLFTKTLIIKIINDQPDNTAFSVSKIFSQKASNTSKDASNTANVGQFVKLINQQCTASNEEIANSSVILANYVSSGNQVYICSGNLVNNERNDKTGYILTAAHCGQHDGGFDENPDIVAVWGAKVRCGKPFKTSLDGELPTSKKFETVAHGSIDNRMEGNDYWLLKAKDIPSKANPYWSGIDFNAVTVKDKTESNPNLKWAYTMHHPLTLNLSYAYANPELPKGSITHFENKKRSAVEFYQYGTYFGSSGSSLYDQNGNIRGVLSFLSNNKIYFSDVSLANIKTILSPNGNIVSGMSNNPSQPNINLAMEPNTDGTIKISFASKNASKCDFASEPNINFGQVWQDDVVYSFNVDNKPQKLSMVCTNQNGERTSKTLNTEEIKNATFDIDTKNPPVFTAPAKEDLAGGSLNSWMLYLFIMVVVGKLHIIEKKKLFQSIENKPICGAPIL